MDQDFLNEVNKVNSYSIMLEVGRILSQMYMPVCIEQDLFNLFSRIYESFLDSYRTDYEKHEFRNKVFFELSPHYSSGGASNLKKLKKLVYSEKESKELSA